MKGVVVLLDTFQGRPAAARLIDGQLDDLLIDAGDDIPTPGTLFRAICDRPLKGQGGMFVTLGPGLKGFLRQAKELAQGAHVLVQVTGYAEPGKAIPVTQKVLFKSRYVIVTPGAPGLNVARAIKDDATRDRLLELAHDALPVERGDWGVILRSACLHAEAEAILDDLSAVWETAHAVLSDDGQEAERLFDGPDAHGLAWRDWAEPLPDEVIEGGFDAYDLATEIDTLKAPKLSLGRATCLLYTSPSPRDA